MLVQAEGQQQREGCSGRCGNLAISDPFWLLDIKTGRSCGASDFEVLCNNNTLILQSSAFGFTILNISYEERSLRAVDLGKVELLHAPNSCSVRYPTWNTSAKLGPQIRISDTNQNLFLYNCTEAAAAARRDDRDLAGTRLRCGNQSEILVSVGGRYDEMSDYAGYAVEGCEATVVPVLGGSNGVANASNYEQLVGDGFLLSWGGLPPLPIARKFAHPSHHL